MNKQVQVAESATDHRRFYRDDKTTRDEVFKSTYQTDRKSTSVTRPGDGMETIDDEKGLNLRSGKWTITARYQKCLYTPNDGAVEKWKPGLRKLARKFETQFLETIRAEERTEACVAPANECEPLDAEAERLVYEREVLWNHLLQEIKLSL